MHHERLFHTNYNMLSTINVLVSFVAVMGEISASTPPATLKFGYPETSSWLQLYEDAWKFMTKEDPLYLAYTNFKTSRLGPDMSCVRANRIAMNEANHEIAHNVTYYNATAKKTLSFTKVYRAISSEDYSTKNILISTVPGEGNNIYPVAFAGSECAILRDDGKTNGTFKACELWVRESTSKNPALCCDFIFDLLCSTGYKLITYYKPFCTADDEE